MAGFTIYMALHPGHIGFLQLTFFELFAQMSLRMGIPGKYHNAGSRVV